MKLNFKGDSKSLRQDLDALQRKQIPFAISLALNSLARAVVVIENEEIGKTFKSPTPFTQNAYRIEVATKTKRTAVVAAKDVQAQYLTPYVIGGDRSLWSKKGTKRGMIVPRSGKVSLNAYGNLTKGKMASLRAKANVFVGPLKTKNGLVSGVWQGYNGNRRQRGGPASGMKLLIRFADTTPAPKRLPFEQRARAYIARNAEQAFTEALKRAFATSR